MHAVVRSCKGSMNSAVATTTSCCCKRSSSSSSNRERRRRRRWLRRVVTEVVVGHNHVTCFSRRRWLEGRAAVGRRPSSGRRERERERARSGNHCCSQSFYIPSWAPAALLPLCVLGRMENSALKVLADRRRNLIHSQTVGASGSAVFPPPPPARFKFHRLTHKECS